MAAPIPDAPAVTRTRNPDGGFSRSRKVIFVSALIEPRAEGSYRQAESGEMNIFRAFQMQHLPDFRGCGDFKGKFLKNMTDLPHLLGVTRRLDAAAEI